MSVRGSGSRPGHRLRETRFASVYKVITLFGGVLLSKVFGLLRELALAYSFGTSFVADAFRVALSAILIPTHLLTGEALFSAFVPAYKRLPESKRPQLVRVVATGLVGASLLLTVVLLLAAPVVVELLAPGFSAVAATTCARILRVAAVGVILYAVSALLINIQVAHDSYVTYSARPTLQNLGILAAVVAAYVWQAPALLGLGFVAAFLVLAIWSLIETSRAGLGVGQVFRISLDLLGPETREFRRALGQLSLFVLVVQLSLVVDRIVASLTGEGGVAALDYAFFVTDSTRFLIAVPLATFALGRLGGRDWSTTSGTVERTMGVVVVATLSLSILLWSVASDLVTVLYRRGEFEAVSTQLTTASLRGFSVGLWAATAGYFLQRVFNATLRNKEVATAGVCALAANAALDVALYRPLGVFGISLATSISNALLFFVLMWYSRLTGSVARRVLLPAVILSLLLPLLMMVSGRGLGSLVVATLLTLGLTAAVCWLWPPLRRDIAWLASRLVPRVGDATSGRRKGLE